MRRGLGWLVLVAGCDNVFQLGAVTPPPPDVAPDAIVLANHDEDHDGIDDAIDNCPADPNPLQEDGDLDQVGDVCDPHPTLAIDRIRYFDSFEAFSQSHWTPLGFGPWVQGDDAVMQTYDSAGDPQGGNQLLIDTDELVVDPSIEVYISSNTTTSVYDNSAGVYFVTGGGAPEPDGLSCYVAQVSNALEVYAVPSAGTSFGDAPLVGTTYPVRLLFRASDGTGAGLPSCTAQRADGGPVTTMLASPALQIPQAKVGLYTYFATATFTSVTVFDRRP